MLDGNLSPTPIIDGKSETPVRTLQFLYSGVQYLYMPAMLNPSALLTARDLGLPVEDQEPLDGKP